MSEFKSYALFWEISQMFKNVNNTDTGSLTQNCLVSTGVLCWGMSHPAIIQNKKGHVPWPNAAWTIKEFPWKVKWNQMLHLIMNAKPYHQAIHCLDTGFYIIFSAPTCHVLKKKVCSLYEELSATYKCKTWWNKIIFSV